MLPTRLALPLMRLAVAALVLAACGGVPAPTPLPPALTAAPISAQPPVRTSTPKPAPTATPPSAEAILQAAFGASQRASSYRFAMDMLMKLSGPNITDGTEIPMRFTGDVQPPDRMQGAMTMSANGVDSETQVIVMGGTSYFKNPLTNKWQLNPQTTMLFNPKALMMDASDVEELEFLGVETVEDTPVYHLTGRARLPFTFDEPLGKVQTEMLVNYWISQEDQRLLQATVAGDIEFSGQITGTQTFSMTMRVFDYNVLVEIAAPEIAALTSISVPEVGPIAVQAPLLAALESDTPEGHVKRGLVSLADGRLGLALAHFDRALALRPDWVDALLYRGATLAIDGNLDTALADLDRAIEAEPDRADAHALRAWVHLRAIVRKKAESATAIAKARADIARALVLDPDLSAAAGLKAVADVAEALGLFDSDQAKATAQFEAGMADLEEVLRRDPDAAAGNYLSMLQTLAQLKMQDRAWLAGQVDEASLQIAKNPRSYADYGVRGLGKLFLGSQPSPNVQTLREAGDDLLNSIALAHDHMPALANPAGGPLQVARIWDLQEAAYASGSLYAQVFFSQNPQIFPEFAQMLTSYWELHDPFIQFVDDPIIFSVAFSPDGKQIATLSESGPSYLRIWDATTGERLREVELGLDGRVIATTAGDLAYSPDGTQIVVAYTNPVVRVIDAATGEVTLEIKHEKTVHSAAFSPDGKRIVTVDPDTDAPIVWDAETGAMLPAVKAGSSVGAAAFSPDGRQIVGSGEKIQLWDVETGEAVNTLPGYDSRYVNAPAISPDGRQLAVPGFPARVYDLNTKKELFAIPTGADTVTFSRDGTRIATAGYGVAGVWDAKSGDLIFLAGHPFGADSAAFSPDGRLLVTGGPDGRFRVWDAETGAELRSGMAATLWWDVAD